MYRWCNKCCCNNNSDEDISPLDDSSCMDVSSYSDEDCNMNKCNCGFDEQESVFPVNPMLGQSYVPIQKMSKVFTPICGLKNGTIFPELVSPYYPCQSVEDIEYLKSRNTIGKGCNK